MALGRCAPADQRRPIVKKTIAAGEISVIIPLLNTTPLFTVLFSAVFLRKIETVNLRIILGAATMVAGVLLITIR